MAKTVKLTKMASNDYPHPTVSGSEGSIHINLQRRLLLALNREEGALRAPIIAKLPKSV
jgi:hypothetical protein